MQARLTFEKFLRWRMNFTGDEPAPLFEKANLFQLGWRVAQTVGLGEAPVRITLQACGIAVDASMNLNHRRQGSTVAVQNIRPVGPLGLLAQSRQ